MCKLERYGNCDEETKDQEYCIFHKPNKSEEEAREFYEKFLKKFKPKKEKIWDKFERERLVFEETADYRGYAFPEIPKGVDFSFAHSVFKESARFDRATFEGDAIFVWATFEGDARFDEATFKGNVGFIRATFERVARFVGATFEGVALFNGVTFKGKAQFNGDTFKGDAWFEDATFKGKAQFAGATFEGGARFEDTTFKGDAWFIRATFEGDAWFKGVTFEGDAIFVWATFEGDASFLATFKEEAIFEEATFKGEATFSRAKFKGNVGFIRATFERVARFVGATFEGNASFGRVTFKGEARFEGATFEGVADFREKKEDFEYKFYGELDFSNTEFRKGVDIDIPSEWFKLPSAEAEACRVQRISYEREGKKDDADRMFARERRALRKAEVEEAKANVKKVKEELKRLIASSPRKVERIKAELKAWFNLIKVTSNYLLVKGRSSLEFFIADLTCEYGTNWKRPVISWIFLVFFIFPLLYFILGGITKVSSPLDYLYFSIVTATTLGYGDLQPVGWCRLIASTEAIFGTFMWAVFLVVFARKYMR